jgi:hypothetical protein
VPFGLGRGAFDDELGEILIIALDLPGLLRDLRREARDRRLPFEFGGDAIRGVGDRFGLPLAGLLVAGGAIVAQFGEVDGAVAIVLRVSLEDYALDLGDQAIRYAIRGAQLLDELLR